MTVSAGAISIAGLVVELVICSSLAAAHRLTPDLAHSTLADRLVALGEYSEADGQQYVESQVGTETALIEMADVIALGTVVATRPLRREDGVPSDDVVLAVEKCLVGSCGDTLHFGAITGGAHSEPYLVDERVVVLLTRAHGKKDGLWGTGPEQKYGIVGGLVTRKGIAIETFLMELEAILQQRRPDTLLDQADHFVVGTVEEILETRVVHVREPRPQPERHLLFRVERVLKGDLQLGTVRVHLPAHGTLRYSDVPPIEPADSLALFLRELADGRLELFGGKAAGVSVTEADALVRTSPN